MRLVGANHARSASLCVLPTGLSFILHPFRLHPSALANDWRRRTALGRADCRGAARERTITPQARTLNGASKPPRQALRSVLWKAYITFARQAFFDRRGCRQKATCGVFSAPHGAAGFLATSAQAGGRRIPISVLKPPTGGDGRSKSVALAGAWETNRDKSSTSSRWWQEDRRPLRGCAYRRTRLVVTGASLTQVLDSLHMMVQFYHEQSGNNSASLRKSAPSVAGMDCGLPARGRRPADGIHLANDLYLRTHLLCAASRHRTSQAMGAAGFVHARWFLHHVLLASIGQPAIGHFDPTEIVMQGLGYPAMCAVLGFVLGIVSESPDRIVISRNSADDRAEFQPPPIDRK